MVDQLVIEAAGILNARASRVVAVIVVYPFNSTSLAIFALLFELDLYGIPALSLK